jgi:lipopolysaccharide/colanic/teichoic acid biosynthesis glycosyltransferase
MRVWPILLDSQPAYLQGRGRSASLLLAPLGRQTLIEHLRSGLAPVTRNAPMVLSPQGTDAEYRRWVRAVYPTARVMGGQEEVADVLAGLELSDALLIVDPRCLPIRDLQLSALIRHYAAEPRVAHHLVAFETAVAGTKERVSFDTTGQVRGIQRYYEDATWPFIAGIAAAIVPVACGVLADGLTPASLAELRQVLTARGVPIRDFSVEGGAHDLTGEGGLLAANEQFIAQATDARQNGHASSAPIYVGAGHSTHTTARIVGTVVIHPGACIEDRATVLGPAVIGAGARIAAGAVVAHAVIGPDCTVPSGRIIRDRAWFGHAEEHAPPSFDHPALSYGDRLARLAVDAGSGLHDQDPAAHSARPHLFLKRALDVAVAGLSLALLSPLLLVIAVVIWLESRGSVLYGDIREGVGGHEFRCWKFRTMYVGAHAAQRELTGLDQMDGPHFKLARDPRVSRVGRVLRALNLDEVPQLLNVLLGQMSLVGPRPSPFRENQICVPWREARLSVRPGITGFWQVCRHDRCAGDFHQWIEYDLLYVQHASFWLDVKILAATLLTLGGKAAHVPASWLVRGAEPAGTEGVRRGRRAEQVVAT